MRFYNREKEVKTLHTIENSSQTSSRKTIMVVSEGGIWKRTFFKNYPKKVYLFVSKKDEALLCEEFKLIIEQSLDTKILGEFREFSKLFEYIMILAQSQSFTLIIDDIQEFTYINPSVFGAMQSIWDKYKNKTRLNLILCIDQLTYEKYC